MGELSFQGGWVGLVLLLEEKLADTQLIEHVQVGGWIGCVGGVGLVGCLPEVVG